MPVAQGEIKECLRGAEPMIALYDRARASDETSDTDETEGDERDAKLAGAVTAVERGLRRVACRAASQGCSGLCGRRATRGGSSAGGEVVGRGSRDGSVDCLGSVARDPGGARGKRVADGSDGRARSAERCAVVGDS